MAPVINKELVQGSDEWYAARCGLLTASEMHLIVTPTGKAAKNDKERSHLWELLAQRITGHVEPHYISDDMLRGHEDEIEAVSLYEKHYDGVERVGFITNDKWGFTLGYSPDGLVGSDGLIECKSRRQKYQIQTILEYLPNAEIDPAYYIQVQTGLLVSERDWCDLVSYCGGMPLVVVRVYPDEAMQMQIISAARAFESRIAEYREKFDEASKGLVQTERKIEQEMFV